MHDDTQLARVALMAQSLQDGQFPVRWVKDLGYGYGYPIFNFYNPLPYYLGALPVLFGFNAIAGEKFMFALPILMAAAGMFVLINKHFGTGAALVAATLYTYAPYHAVQIYVRGSVAEYWAYAIIPWLLHFLLKKQTLASAISLAILITSHNLTTIMVVPFLGLFILVDLLLSKNKFLCLKHYALSLMLALGTSAFFWLPATMEKHLTNVDTMVNEQFNPLQHFVYPRQLWYMPWGFGGSTADEHDGLSFMIGTTHILLAFFGLVVFIKRRQQKNLFLVACSLSLIALFMLLPISRQTWIIGLPILKYLQFPWRYLSFVVFGSSILGAIAVHAFKKIPHFHLGVAVTICLIILVNLQYFQAQFKYGETAEQLLSAENIQWEYSRRSDEYLPQGFIRPESADVALRIKDIRNQQLVDNLLADTPLRRTSNYISLLTLLAIISLSVMRIPRHKED